eukprot:jgi/Galph1/235/GphlegSOOS_G4983.1
MVWWRKRMIRPSEGYHRYRRRRIGKRIIYRWLLFFIGCLLLYYWQYLKTTEIISTVPWDSIIEGNRPKGPLRFLYYDNILTMCDWPLLGEGILSPDDFWFSGLDEQNKWKAIYGMTGISHARNNLACLLQEATVLQAVAVLPSVCLSPLHNQGKWIRSHWSKYLYMDRLKQAFPIVANVTLLESLLSSYFPEYQSVPFPLRVTHPANQKAEQVAVSHNQSWTPVIATFSEHTPTEILQQSQATILIRHFHTNQEYAVCTNLSNANKDERVNHVWNFFWSSAETDPQPAIEWIRSTNGSDSFFCLHLRRGDKLNEARYPCLNFYTSGEHILSVLHDASVPCGTTIYILSNENRTSLLSLFSHWNHSCYSLIYQHDVPYLQLPKFQEDNYLLYETERRICQQAIGYIETHRTAHAYDHLLWNLRLTPYEEECAENDSSPSCQVTCGE